MGKLECVPNLFICFPHFISSVFHWFLSSSLAFSFLLVIEKLLLGNLDDVAFSFFLKPSC